LSYITLRLAAATAHVWWQLPQLQELSVDDSSSESGTDVYVQSMLAGVAAATSLTSLHLHSLSLANEHMADIVVCPRIAGLSRLEKLHIQSSNPHDVQALTALTGLTHLDLARSWESVGTDTATALARSLTRLRHLDLRGCREVDLGSAELMLALGQLTQLTLLDIAQGSDDSQLTVGGLMQLTGLRHLEELMFTHSAEITQDVLDVFWAAVRGQHMS
jgi:Leucine-rich repeat (LRR) protein